MLFKNSTKPELRQDFFQVEGTHCFLCEEMESCMVCPLMAAYTTGTPGHVSCTLCRLKKIQLKSLKRFREQIRKKGAVHDYQNHLPEGL
ncbi:MAG: hypothetical protein GY757_36530 [bacterium]|nr:hypothetical protein [bacterium]